MHRVTTNRSGAVPVVVARGELDAFAEPDLSAAFAELANELQVVVDLEAVSFLDSTALGAVVRSVREVGERGGEALVVLPATAARRIFEITTLDRVLPTSPSRAQALEAFTREG
ncbi:MAG TPA: STAS domain-containing protein [Gaiellaceae bacterium]|nr:STAS domain-containing protein [Gaiellaceae bacterium]